MSGRFPPVSDEDLHGFVDGEIEGDRRDAVVDFLAASPADAARVEMWRRQNEIIRAAFARVEAEPALPFASLPPSPTKKIFARQILPGAPLRQDRPGLNDSSGIRIWSAGVKFWRDHRQTRWLLAAFASGLIAAAFGAILFDRLNAANRDAFDAISPASDDIFAQRTQSALLAFAPQKAVKTASAARDNSTREPRQSALVVPNLSAVGLTLVGVRVVPGPVGQMFCFFYAEGQAAPIGLCAERDDAGAGQRSSAVKKFSPRGHDASGTIIWRQDNAKYALTGRRPEAELRNLAARISAEVEAFDIR